MFGWMRLAILLALVAGPVGAQVPAPPPTPEALAAQVQALRKEQQTQQRRLSQARNALKDQLLQAQQDIAILQNELVEQQQAVRQLHGERGYILGAAIAGILLGLAALGALAASLRSARPVGSALETELRGLRRKRRSLLADLEAQEARARALRLALEEDRMRGG